MSENTNVKKGQKVPAYPVSKHTKKDQRRTSVGYSIISVIIYIIAIIPLIFVPAVLAVRSYTLAPYYTFWPFVGVIIGGVFTLIFAVVTLVVARKNTPSDIRTQTVKIATTYLFLTAGFALILTYVFPDVIEFATQNTLFCEDMYYMGEEQANINIRLDRDFMMYNLLNGNLNKYDSDGSIADHGDFSYTVLSRRVEDNGVLCYYENEDIDAKYREYVDYGDVATIQSQFIDTMKKNDPRKYELYEFIYNKYVLNDFDYAFSNSIERRAFALSLIDYIYENFDYNQLLQQGFKNERLKTLFFDNFSSFKEDGYDTFDDPLLLYAQQPGRMTIPVVIRLLLNEGWKSSQSVWNANGEPEYNEEGNCLYQLYDPDTRDKFVEAGGTFDRVGKLTGEDGVKIDVNYGYNEDGWMIFENGVVKRPMEWLVLDMLGDPMSIVSLQNDIIGLVQSVLNQFPTLIDAVGNVIGPELTEGVLVEALNGAKLRLGLCIDDDNALTINLFPMNHYYGMLGFMQVSWMESNNLLMAVINIVALRNWLAIFSSIGLVLVIGAGVLRECGRRTRERTDRARASIKRSLKGEVTLPDKEEKVEEPAKKAKSSKDGKSAPKDAKGSSKSAPSKSDSKSSSSKNAPAKNAPSKSGSSSKSAPSKNGAPAKKPAPKK